jgi:hypothetical protein
MKARELLGAAAGLLLPLPLVLLLSSAFRYQGAMLNPDAPPVSPMLHKDQRLGRITYLSPCQDTSDCEPPLGCFADIREGGGFYCADSECTLDTQCGPNQVCRFVTSLGEGPLLRRCVPDGFRGEAERCWPVTWNHYGACGPGLQCSGGGWCARPCMKGHDASCPDGFFCADVSPMPLCLPTCDEWSCPQGQQCVPFKQGASACAVVHGEDCRDDPACPRCEVRTAPNRPGEVWRECRRPCGTGLPACPEGSGCYEGRCVPACVPGEPGACASGWFCGRLKGEGHPWLCLQDWQLDPLNFQVMEWAPDLETSSVPVHPAK